MPKVHWLFTARVPLESAMVRGAVVVTVPPLQLPNVPLVTVSPTGRVSVNATPVSGSGLAAGLVTVKVSDEVAFSAMLVGLKALLRVGGPSTFRLADAVPPAPPSVEFTLPVVLLFVPALVPVTFTENVHPVLAARVAPDKLMLLDAAVAVIVPPPQLPVSPLGVATTRPPGNVSLYPMPLSDVLAFGLLIVKLSEVEPFNGILAAPNDLLMVGGEVADVTVSRETVMALWPSGLVIVTFLKPGVATVVLRLKVTWVGSVYVTLLTVTPPETVAEM